MGRAEVEPHTGTQAPQNLSHNATPDQHQSKALLDREWTNPFSYPRNQEPYLDVVANTYLQWPASTQRQDSVTAPSTPGHHPISKFCDRPWSVPQDKQQGLEPPVGRRGCSLRRALRGREEDLIRSWSLSRDPRVALMTPAAVTAVSRTNSDFLHEF